MRGTVRCIGARAPYMGIAHADAEGDGTAVPGGGGAGEEDDGSDEGGDGPPPGAAAAGGGGGARSRRLRAQFAARARALVAEASARALARGRVVRRAGRAHRVGPLATAAAAAGPSREVARAGKR